MNDMEKQTFLLNFERELAITKKVIEAYPEGKLDLKPHDKSRNAKDLLHLFAQEVSFVELLAKGSKAWDQTEQGKGETVADIVKQFEEVSARVVETVKNTSIEDLTRKENIFGMDIRFIDGMWFMLLDQIHHRGQLSVYIRLADGKVPQIYGPSADFPM